MNRVKTLTVISILGTMSFILMLLTQFPIVPGVSFLKMDFSFVPVFLGAMLLNVKTGYAILGLRSVLKLLLDNGGVETYIGLPMNIIGLAILLTIVMKFLGSDFKSWRMTSYIVASVLGIFGLTLAMTAMNYVYGIPLYAWLVKFDINQIFGTANYLWYMVVPFNLVSGAIMMLVIGMLVFPFKNIFTRLRQQLQA
ncbi:ECF transporter S component [Weissella tructae]|uniref:Riboflavin transporter n=2 Tax=Weissella TaxID=46255 RepID=A0A075TZF2_9LACO|nr:MULTISPECIES: ECF transporter S component [Weissella]AIG65666.1 Riboflavin transporter [Weissella tructae]AIM62981.1 Riboflavin transporter [Weissella ceti]AIM64380.1 Riboflavin transporter [Weissella ceti]ELA06880.1 hypothetical protein WCNC_04852 [Weissella ceti NC36]QVV90786.1 ECF transporter S component [Weissella tructae]